jgi:hypothetical protein
MSDQWITDGFTKSGALLEGHFVLRSGLHSEKFFQAALLLQHPDLAGKFCSELAAKFNAVITPNPTNTVAYLSLTLADDANVQISIYDASGLKVKSLTNKVLPSGMHSFVIDAKHLSSGAYFALIRVNDRTFTLKFVVGK